MTAKMTPYSLGYSVIKCHRDHIPTSTLYTHYLQHGKNIVRNGNYVQNHININIDIILL